jgi:hypothetical protein
VIVWLWDAGGAVRSGRGITDEEARARQAAEAWLRDGTADSARIEMALTVLGAATLTFGYERTGEGWVAAGNRSGQITWTPLTATQPELAAS